MDSKEAFKQEIQDIAGLEDSIDRADRLEKACRAYGVKESVGKAALKEAIAIRKEAAAAGLLDPAFNELYVGEDVPRLVVFDRLAKLLLESARFYEYADGLVVVHLDQLVPIDTRAKLQSKINELVECFITKSKKKLYRLFPADHADSFLAGGFEGRFNKIKVFADLPILGPDYSVVPLGYNADLMIYRAGKELKSKWGLATIDSLIGEFSFQSPRSDRAHVIAMMLTALLHHLFPGMVPILMVIANQRGLGKSLLVQLISIIRQGDPVPTIALIDDEIELEKRSGAVAKAGHKVLFYDNAKISKVLSAISSALIEKNSTSPMLGFRILGTSEEYSAHNDVLTAITANGVQPISPDAISRGLFVRLHHDGDPNRRRFTHKNLVQVAQAKREEVIAELLGLVETWIAKGRPLADVRDRFPDWAEVVGGILQANGIEGFLENQNEAAAEHDEDLQHFFELVVRCTLGKTYTTRDLLKKIADSQGLFAKPLEGKDSRARAVSFGKILTRFIGEHELPGGQSIAFRRVGTDAEKSAQYMFVEVAPEMAGDTTGSKIVDLRPGHAHDSQPLTDLSGGPEVDSVPSTDENEGLSDESRGEG